MVIQFIEDVSALASYQPTILTYSNCWHSASNFTMGPYYLNPAFSASLTMRVYGAFTSTPLSHGMVRSTTVTISGSGGAVQWSGRVTLQAGRIGASGGVDLQFVADLAIYDRTTTAALNADYWSFVFFQNGGLAGNGNTATTVVSATKWSSIGYMVATASWVATGTVGSGGTPFLVGATSYAIGSLPVFNTTAQIGIYKTE